MKHPLLAATMAVSTLSGCATVPTVATACDVSLRAANTAEALIPVLERDWNLNPEKAAQWAGIIMKGSAGIAMFCALVSA